ncbi:MAG: hypothetical protein LBS61_02825 [Endomicrobium sp.]|nr:hypothetical protein [Endomicrobium sp.]
MIEKSPGKKLVVMILAATLVAATVVTPRAFANNEDRVEQVAVAFRPPVISPEEALRQWEEDWERLSQLNRGMVEREDAVSERVLEAADFEFSLFPLAVEFVRPEQGTERELQWQDRGRQMREWGQRVRERRLQLLRQQQHQRQEWQQEQQWQRQQDAERRCRRNLQPIPQDEAVALSRKDIFGRLVTMVAYWICIFKICNPILARPIYVQRPI